MIRTIALAATLLAPLTAHAQAPAPMPLEAQALGVTSWIAQVTQEIAALKAQNASLLRELAEAAKAKSQGDQPARIVPVPPDTSPAK